MGISLRDQMKNKVNRRLRGSRLDGIIDLMSNNLEDYSDILIFDVIQAPCEPLDKIVSTEYDIPTRKYIVSFQGQARDNEIIYSIVREIVNVVGGYKFLPINNKLDGEMSNKLILFAKKFGELVYDTNPIANCEIFRIGNMERWVENSVDKYRHSSARKASLLENLGVSTTEELINIVNTWGSMPYFYILEKAEESLKRNGIIEVYDSKKLSKITFKDNEICIEDKIGQVKTLKNGNLDEYGDNLGDQIQCKNDDKVDISNYKEVKMKLKINDEYSVQDTNWYYKLKHIVNLFTPDEFASFKTPDRRFAFHGLIVQGITKEQKRNIKGIDFYLDTSISMSYNSIKKAVSIADSNTFANLDNRYYSFGSTVNKVKKSDVLNRELKRYGSTKSKPVVEQINSEGKNRLSIIVSDGEFEWSHFESVKNETVVLYMTRQINKRYKNVHLIQMKEG